MLTLALTLLTTQGVIVPSNHSLEARAEGYSDFGARLTRGNVNAIGEGMLLAQAEAPPPPPPAIGGPEPVGAPRTLQDLRAEYQRLDESRPGLVAPIVMLAIGVPAAIIGFYFVYDGLVTILLSGNSSALFLTGVIFTGVGVVLLIAGVVLAIIGGVKLGRTLGQRREIGNQMEDIKKQIEALESAPPPPPPPSSVQRMEAPKTAFTVATF